MSSSTIRRTAVTLAAVICIAIPASAQASGRSDAAQLSGANTPEITASPVPFRGGDYPADHPGMPGTTEYTSPTTIEVVRPERTIVRDVDAAFPIILSGTALLLVVAALCVPLVRSRTSYLGRRSA